MGQYNDFQGSKYVAGRSMRELKSLVAKDIKAAVKKGELPAADYQIRVQSGGTGTMRISVGGLPFKVATDRALEWNAPVYLRETEEAREVQEKVKKLANEYNYDRSDIMTDYFDCGFYCYVGLADFEAEREAMKKAQEEREAAKAAAAAPPAAPAAKVLKFEKPEPELPYGLEAAMELRS